ncbi:MAG: hypothetical protein QM638_18665 [Nocardioides sp.]|uniref:hypothetical protein n=1 Tax=Nocardioides sp. TaxID=35761 RepID=UPI0039E5FF2F
MSATYCGQCGQRLGTGRFCAYCGADARPQDAGTPPVTSSAPAPAGDETVIRPIPAGLTDPTDRADRAQTASAPPSSAPPSTPPPANPAPANPAPANPAPSEPVVAPPVTSAPRGARYPLFADEQSAAGPASYAEDRTQVRPAIRTGEHRVMGSLAESAIRPSAHPDHTYLPAAPPADATVRVQRADQPSAWVVSLWVLLCFLIVMLAAGVWLLAR